jgi:hypothetical protein
VTPSRRAAHNRRKLTLDLVQETQAAQKLRKLTLNLDQLMRAGHDHVLELTPDGLLTYGGGYAEYVVAAGHEAPGLGG